MVAIVTSQLKILNKTMESSTKARLVLAGLLTAGVSSAVLYAVHNRKLQTVHLQVNQPETREPETALPVTDSTDLHQDGTVSPEDGSPTSPADSVPRGKILYRGLEVSLSSSLLRAYILARRVKSAGWSVVFWDGNDAHGDGKLHGTDGDTSFLYGRFRFRSAQDLTTGRTFLLERCSSDVTMSSARRRLTVAFRSPSSDNVPPVTEIFPLSVLRKAGICRDSDYGDEDEASNSGLVSRKHNGKIVRYIRSYRRRESVAEADVVGDVVGDVGQSEVVRSFRQTDSGRGRGRLGSEFEELYHRMYDDYHAVVTPNTPVVVFHSHTK